MIALTNLIGLLLILLTVVLYALHDPNASVVTAFIPAIVGVLLILFALLARGESRRKLAMHLAMGIALLGMVAAGGRLAMVLAMGKEFGLAAVGVTIMTLICAVYLAFGVRSFVNARKQPTTTELS